MRHTKRALSRLDIKRYYERQNLSYGYEHPLCRNKDDDDFKKSSLSPKPRKRIRKRKLMAGSREDFSYHITKDLQTKITRYI